MSRNLRLTIEFDGTLFCGWQRQPGLRTVEGVLRDAIKSMVQHDVKLATSSRTDSGVHARALPVGFETEKDISTYGFMRGLNTRLPEDVKVLEVEEMPEGWYVRTAAAAKTYVYRFQYGVAALPLWRHRAHYIKRPTLDVEAMDAAARLFEGIHDFQSFRFVACQATVTTRKMHSLRVRSLIDESIAMLEITGSGFLHNMVRIVAGTLLQVGIVQREASTIATLLATNDRRAAGPTLPAKGLTLVKVHFEGYPRYGKSGIIDES